MQIDHENKTIWIRQSWLDTYFRCPEEARQAIVFPEMAGCTDEAFIGTAAHAGIEAFINGLDEHMARKAVRDEYRNNPEARDLRFTKRNDLEECIDLSERCYDAWIRDIMPHAPLEGAKAEVEFAVIIMEYRGWLIGIKGTADLVPALGNIIWDWKTSGKDYKQKDKQKWAIQPTIYGMAAVLGAFGRDDFRWPLKFTYGVMVKLKRQCRGQMVTVERNREHVAWAEHRIKGAVDLFIDFGLEKPWPMIDDSNWLCSATWCDFYEQCRGAHITPKSDLFGWNPPAAA